MNTTPPNIVLIMADQLAAGFLGCYGSGVDSTPTLDRMAARGVRFDRCYATCPVCAPNRATLLTGRSPVVHGLITNNYALPTDTPTFPHLLQARGYRTGGFGKFHQHPMPMPVIREAPFLGFDESIVSEDRKWGAWLDWVEREAPEHFETALALTWGAPQTGDPARAHQADRKQAAAQRILGPCKQASGWRTMWKSPLPAELHDTTFMTNAGLDFMRRHLADHGEQPFFCQVSYVDPHDPYDPPAPYADMFAPADMPCALHAEWEEQGPRALLDNQRCYLGFDEIAHKPDMIARMRALYHGSLRFLDDQIARIIGFLEEHELADNTIVLFTTDHGEMMGDHGLIAKGTPHYDLGVRVPLLVAGAGISSNASDRLTCTLDFYPTFCDWAGIGDEERPPLEGKSFASSAAGEPEAEPWREISVAFSQVESVITDDRWRLTRFVKSGEAQMFDLGQDPHEQCNLYRAPESAAKRQELLERLLLVAARPHTVPHYRNMPILEGRKCRLGGTGSAQFMPGPPVYDFPPPPSLT